MMLHVNKIINVLGGKMLLLLIWIVNSLVIFGVAHLIPGIVIENMFAALFFAFILGIINTIIRPILMILTLPISIITLGIFTLVVNAFTFWLASVVSFGVEIQTFAAAFWGGLIVWIVTWITNNMLMFSKKQ